MKILSFQKKESLNKNMSELITLDKSYGKLNKGIPYTIDDEGRDFFYINGHHVPKYICKPYEPLISAEKEYEDFI